jgi:hypothetical protein
VRVVVGKRALAEGKIELSLRADREKKMVARADLLAEVKELTSAS